jgi:hypothetical protein
MSAAVVGAACATVLMTAGAKGVGFDRLAGSNIRKSSRCLSCC